MRLFAAAAPSDSPPDPPQDQCAPTFSTNIEFLLHAARGLLGYGRHMFDTIHQRAVTPTFSAIAACFGTANVPTIIAHVARGMLRATALERVLLARAAAGKDIDFVERHKPEPHPAAADAEPQQQPVGPPTPRKHAPRRSRPTGWDDPELYMPTLEELERQVRRRPIGRTIFEICLDLGVVPALCHSAFWNELFEIMNWFGGGNAVDQLMREKSRRREAFANEQDRNPKANWDWLRLKPDDLRGVLGFFIGEPPVNPFDPAAAIATAPP
jgi:hypothetical protein